MAKAGPLRKVGGKVGAKAEKQAKAASRAIPAKQASAKRAGESAGESHRKPTASRIPRVGKLGGAGGRPVSAEPVVAPEAPPPLPAPIASFTF